jgi:nicotinamidase-related amidase
MENVEKYLRLRRNFMGDIDPKKTVLLVIDMQKYQVEREWAVYKIMDANSPGLLEYFVEEVQKKVVPNLQKLIQFCHEMKIPVIYTKFSSFRVDGSDLPKPIQTQNKMAKEFMGLVPYPHIADPSSEIIDDLKVEKEDVILQKNTSGVFISTRLDSYLKNMGVETVLVCGVVTNFCVESSAREAADYGFQVVMLDDCCAAWSPELQQAALKTFELLYGYVMSFEKVIKKLTRKMKVKQTPTVQ